MAQTMFLYPWQQSIADEKVRILRKEVFLLDSSETGTGKTATTCYAVKQLDIPWALVAPKAVHRSWRDTIKAMDTPEPFDIVNVERLRFKNRLFIPPSKWNMPEGALICVDEPQRGASGYKSKTTLILAWARKAGLKMLALSATAASNPLQMRLILYYAGICGWNISEFLGFCRRHGCHASPFHAGLEFCKGRRAVEHMQIIGNMLSDKMVRLRVSDAPGFPECLIESRLFSVDESYKEKIEQITLELPEELLATTDSELVNMLRERQKLERFKVPVLAELVRDAIEEGKTPVVFVTFRDTLFALQSELSELSNVGVIVGGQSDKERERVMQDAAADKCQCIIATIASGGTGISLQARPGMRLRVSFISPDFSVSNVVQALGRLWRAGGTRVVQTFTMLADSIEERVHRAIQGKLDSLTAFNESVSDKDLMGL